MRQIYKRRKADSPENDQYLFLKKQRLPLSDGSVKGMVARLKVRTGITRLHAHLLRHTFATNYLVHGIGDVYELSRLLGHADVKITERYLHIASYYTIIAKRRKRTLLDIL